HGLFYCVRKLPKFAGFIPGPLAQPCVNTKLTYSCGCSGRLQIISGPSSWIMSHARRAEYHHNPRRVQEAGGIYLFDSQAYLKRDYPNSRYLLKLARATSFSATFGCYNPWRLTRNLPMQCER